MCISCYIEYGSPAIISPKTKRAAELIRRVFELSDVGGNAHIVVGDWNLEEVNIEWCLDEGLKSNIHEQNAEGLAIERECLEYLSSLSIEERASALAIHEGFLSLPQPTKEREE